MEINESVESYLDGYLKFLKDKSFEMKVNDRVSKLSLPFLDALDDYTEIYIIKENNEYIITDNGETLSNLEFNGVEINSHARKKIFNNIVNSYNVISNTDGSLYIKANESNLYLKKHLLLQCIVKINDMYMLNRMNVQNIFIDDVKSFFETNKIGYIPGHRMSGKSGLDAYYDLAIPKTEKNPMTLVKVINKLDKDKVKSTIFDWNDTKDLSSDELKVIVVYNDESDRSQNDKVEAFEKYGIKAIPWTKKNDILKEVA